jgi:uncharacterized protein YqfA (UPF0365 family)
MIYVVMVSSLSLVVLLAALKFLALVVRHWLREFLHGLPVSLFQILGMRLRGNPPFVMIDAYIQLRRAGEEVTLTELEHTYIDSRSRIFTGAELVNVFESRFKSR